MPRVPRHHLHQVVRDAEPGGALDVDLDLEPLHGGLTSSEVVRCTARYRTRDGRRRMHRFVVKHLCGDATREAEVYRRVVGPLVADRAPRLLGLAPDGEGGLWMSLEWVRPYRRWPWREPGRARSVSAEIAELHRDLSQDAGTLRDLPSWDYEGELAERAAQTVAALEALPPDAPPRLRRALPAARRLAPRVRRVRRQMIAASPLPAGVIHGDLHPGNVLIRERGGGTRPVLLDRARLRAGSPLEDLAPWLLSLAFWEPLVHRRHDRVLRAYLAARGRRLDTAVRDAYWLAAGLNALAGALAWNLGVLSAERRPRRRAEALEAAAVWARALRQADRRWRDRA